MDGAFANNKHVVEHVLLSNGGGEFQVGVGDSTMGVVPSDQGGLN